MNGLDISGSGRVVIPKDEKNISPANSEALALICSLDDRRVHRRAILGGLSGSLSISISTAVVLVGSSC